MGRITISIMLLMRAIFSTYCEYMRFKKVRYAKYDKISAVKLFAILRYLFLLIVTSPTIVLCNYYLEFNSTIMLIFLSILLI